MGEDNLSTLVRQLVAERIDSVVQLEVLLLLVHQLGERWTADSVSRSLRIDRKWAAGELAVLRTRGLASATVEGAESVYRYQPASPQLDSAVQELARAYADRRVAVVSYIFSKPLDKIQTFADAFRLRKGKSDG